MDGCVLKSHTLACLEAFMFLLAMCLAQVLGFLDCIGKLQQGVSKKSCFSCSLSWKTLKTKASTFSSLP